MRSARSSTSAVTNGLPSRSPPIHDPIRRKEGRSRSADVRVAPLQLVLQRAVQQRHFGQERLLEERQPVGHFVEHVELFEPQHAGLPQREHRAADRFVVGRLFLRREAGAFARLQQLLDLHLQVAHALALDFRGVRRQHRHDHAIAEEPRQ